MQSIKGNEVILVTGGFDPLHSGHIAYFKQAKAVCDVLVVGLNSDEWLARKKGRPFMNYRERECIIKALSMVDHVISYNDDDGHSCNAIQHCLDEGAEHVIFANGGDREKGNTPELDKYIDSDDVTFAWGVGGEDKKNSSSWLLSDWSAPKTERPWGYYKVLYQGDGFKVKELVINPHSQLSMQKHYGRSETWNLVQGEAYLKEKSGTKLKLSQNESVHIPRNTWHQGVNDSNEEAHIVEIWKGAVLTEGDIERLTNQGE